LNTIWQLAFIGESFEYEVEQTVHQSRMGDVIMNLDVMKSLLEIFEQSSSIFIQRLILQKLRDAFYQDSTNYSRSKSVKLFEYLFQKFQHLDQEIQWTILDLLSALALDGHRLGDEFQLYCGLLEVSSPRSVLIVVHHMIEQIRRVPVCKGYFHAAGLMSTLSDFLNYVPSQHPFYDALYEAPKERTLSLNVLLNYSRFKGEYFQNRPHEELIEHDLESSTSGWDLLADISTQGDRSKVEPELLSILQQVFVSILNLITEMIDNHPENQAVFINCNGPTRAHKFLLDKSQRFACLKIFRKLSLMPNVVEWKLMEGLVRVMQVGGNEENLLEAVRCLQPNILELRLHLCQAVREMMVSNPRAKDSFLKFGGIDRLQQLINNMTEQVEKNSPEKTVDAAIVDQVFQLIVHALRTISVVLTDNKEAQT